jgi:hypothetical protein
VKQILHDVLEEVYSKDRRGMTNQPTQTSTTLNYYLMSKTLNFTLFYYSSLEIILVVSYFASAK